MHTMIKSLAFSAILLFSSAINAIEVNGVSVDETITQSATKQTLILNGTGVRTKFIFDIYVGALYLTKKTSDAQKIINGPEAKRISLSFLYDKVESKKMTDGWSDAFADAVDEPRLAKLLDRIKQFNSYFPDIVKGDVVILDFIPNSGVTVSINNTEKGTVPGADFQSALLVVYFGDSPPNEDLKDGMLGIDE